MTLQTEVKAATGNGPRGLYVSYENNNPVNRKSPWRLDLTGFLKVDDETITDWFTTERLREFANNILHLLDQPKIGDDHAGGTVVDLDDNGNPLVEFPNKERTWVRDAEPEASFKPGDCVRRRNGQWFGDLDKYPVVTVREVKESKHFGTQVWFKETDTWLNPEVIQLAK